jgi:DNA polymerase-4
MALRNLFIDFDAYFASVEQQLRPELRDRPVAVVPVMVDTTCCIAASYEAKRYGVKTGTRVGDARRLCRELVLVEARHERYVEYHHRLRVAVESRIPVDAAASIDELACTLSGSWCAPERALAVAREIKAAVREVGERLTCSIGIAPNRFLAKVASKMNKPNGIMLIRSEDLPQALYGLRLDDLTGIGPRMRVRLQQADIETVERLCTANAQELCGIWGGIGGERMYAELRGKSFSELAGARASVGHSHVLPPDMRDEAQALAVLHRLLQKAAWRLRIMDYAAGGLSVTLRYPERPRWSAEQHFVSTRDSLVFARVLTALWNLRPAGAAPILGVGVVLGHLTEAAQQPLFERERARDRLNLAVDRLNERFGAHHARDAAPMRIAFTHIPDPDLER